MFDIGKINRIKVLRTSPHGLYLGHEGDRSAVLLPNKYVPENLSPGEEIDVFIYKDSEDLPIATTLTPRLQVNEFACLKVVDVNKYGVFLDWGLEKDLMVPFSEQNRKMTKGSYYLVYLFLDEESERLVASCQIEHFLERDSTGLEKGQQVELLIGDSSEIGVNVIINNRFKGLLYHNEIYRNLQPGERTTGYIKMIREDKKIDVSLQIPGYTQTDADAQRLMDYLVQNEGYLHLNDQSHPDEIRDRLQMSKKAFKKAVGALYRERKILLEADGIRLI